MAYSMDFMKQIFADQKSRKTKMDDKIAKIYNESLICSQDLVNNEVSFKKIDSSISEFKNNISSLLRWSDSVTTTIVNKDVYSELNSLYGSITADWTTSIKEKIKIASEEVYDEYLRKYKENYLNFDRRVESVEQGLDRAERLENKIKDEVLEEEKEKLKSRKETILSDCQRNIDAMRDANLANRELREKGLEKVSSGNISVGGSGYDVN